jgi:undecaprenyl-diphosphatase
MLISDNQYLNWQKKLEANPAFRRFWVFWGIYSVLIYGVVAANFLVMNRGWKVVAVAVLAALVDRYIICEIIIYFYKKPHPYQKLGFNVISSWLFSFKDQKPDSWPSQHASAAMAISAVILFFSLPWGLISVFTALIIGVARIILGYHYITDVVAGWVIGFLSGLIIVYCLSPWLFTR